MTRYSDDEADAILERALRKGNDTGLRREELIAAAREIGIAPEDIEEAADAVRKERVENDALEAKKNRAKRRLRSSAATYIAIGAFLTALNLVTGGGFWAIYPVLAFVFLIAMQAIRAYGHHELSEREKKKLHAKREKMSRKERRRANAMARQLERKNRKDRVKDAEARFEAAVEDGVAKLLERAAAGLEGVTRGRQESDGEFGDYVRGKRGGKKRRAERGRKKSKDEPRVRAARARDLEDEYAEDELEEAERELEEYLS